MCTHVCVSVVLINSAFLVAVFRDIIIRNISFFPVGCGEDAMVSLQ